MAKVENPAGRIAPEFFEDYPCPENIHRCTFRKRRDMASHCHYVWMRFFWRLRAGEPRVDLIVWEIGEQVNVRPASTVIDESNRAFRPSPPLTFEVWGYKQARKKISNRKGASSEEIAAELASLERELWDSMLQAIVEGLNYKHAQESYTKYNPNELPFSAVATTQDEGLLKSNLTLVWKNDRGPTVPMIRRRAKAIQGQPLFESEREPSPKKQHLKKLAKTRKRQSEAARKQVARETEKAEKRRPAVRRRFIKRIDQAMATLPRSARKVDITKPCFPLSLSEGNQHGRQILPKVTLDQVVDIHLKYNWKDFDEYDNRVMSARTGL